MINGLASLFRADTKGRKLYYNGRHRFYKHILGDFNVILLQVLLQQLKIDYSRPKQKDNRITGKMSVLKY